jgi:glycerol-3-phosphate dehydrogenase
LSKIYDLAIIGGGVNGCGIARDAAGRGHSVFLCEMNDLASGTSSWSSKMIHGGLRYLEFYDFHLVREAVIEREILWQVAPHIIAPERFILPHHDGLRPAWLLRLGLLIYDHLGGRRLLPATQTLNLRKDVAGKPLKPIYTIGFEYSDCTVDDARLVVLNAVDAAARGATIRTRTRAVKTERVNGLWRVTLEDTTTGAQSTLDARILVNAGGPWVEQILSQRTDVAAKAKVRLVQGSHIVVRRLYDHDRAYTFQHADGRVVFVIPYQHDFTLIGTTDRDYDGDPSQVKATEEEIQYLCASVSEYLATQVTPDDVVWSYSGVRPLYDDGASEARMATRDYVFELDTPDGAPILSVFGGKITTYRKLAEHALEKLLPYLDGGKSWTRDAPLPGGDFAVNGLPDLLRQLLHDYPFLPLRLAQRLVRSYGTRAHDALGRANAMADLGHDFGQGLTEREVRYLMEREFAGTADDVIWRRSKLGLLLSKDEVEALEVWMAKQHA